MSEQDIAGLLNEAIDRLAAGDRVENIVAQYERGTELRPMLEAGLLTRRANYPAAEIRDSLARIDSQVLPNLPPPPTFPYWLILPLLIGAGLLAVILIAASNAAAPAIPTPAPTIIIEATETIPATETPIAATPTLSISATLAPESAASVTLFGVLEAGENGGFTINGLPIDASSIASPGLQSGSAVQITGVIRDGQIIASSIATATPAASILPATTPSTDSTTRLVIEGPVQRIEGNIITIHEQNIVLPETPALQVIQVGDVLRLDGQADADKRFIEVQIIFISVDVVINIDGQIWRDPGTCDSPPDWARDAASRWFARCASSPNPAPPANNSGGSNSGGGSGGNNNDDDD